MCSFGQGKKDKIVIEFLPNGLIKVVINGNISMANHTTAEKLLKEIEVAMGGPVKSEKLQGHGHSHSHNHLHQ